MYDNSFVLKEIHDRLLAVKPEDASHDESACGVCNGTITDLEHANVVLQEVPLKTYTEDEHDALLAQVADLESKVKELEGVQQESASEAKIAEAKTQFEAQVSDLQAQLDTAMVEVQAAKDEKESVLKYFEELHAEAEMAAVIESLREERIAKVKEVASFPDEHIAARADAWAALDEEAFDALLADWKAVSGKGTSTEIPVETAMQASRETNQPKAGSLRDVMRMRFEGVDTRAV